MNSHHFLDDDLRDRAALFVLDALPEEEARRIRLHLPHCDTCRAEVESLERAARELTVLAPTVEPPPDLWPRVLAKTRSIPPASELIALSPDHLAADVPAEPPSLPEPHPIQVWRRWLESDTPSPDGFTFVGQDDGAFEPTPVAGIAVRRLSVDAARDRVTMIVRMAAGASFPSHVHGGPEDCIVLAGDLHAGPTTHMHAGDYQHAEKGSIHDVQWTESGCTLFIVSSLHDEILG